MPRLILVNRMFLLGLSAWGKSLGCQGDTYLWLAT
jgi:hypothetical protein